MATITIASACNNGNFALDDNGNHLRDASFSSYLSRGGQTISPPPTAVAAADHPNQLSLGRKFIEEGELGIFSAEKYFSGRMDEMDTAVAVAEKGRKQQSSKEGKMDVPRPKKSFKSATPSTCSEASWNSRSALLHKDPLPNIQRQMSSKNFFSSFGCNCVGSKSIDIDEKNTNSRHCRKIFDLREEPIFIHEPAAVVVGQQTRMILPGKKQNRLEFQYGKEMMSGTTTDNKGNIVGFKRDDCFAFPILNPHVGNLAALQQLVEENARASLEVFGSPPQMIEEGMGSNLHSHSHSHRRFTAMNSNTGSGRIKAAGLGAMDGDDDLGSESSSDLFEIESLPSKANQAFFHPQASDGYESSEASIEWKSNREASVKKIMTRTTNAMGAQRRQPAASLLSCKSTKAVNVVANAHRVPEKSDPGGLRRFQLDSMAPLTRFQAENRAMDFDSANAQRASAMQSLM